MKNSFINNYFRELTETEKAIIIKFLKSNTSKSENSKTILTFNKLVNGEDLSSLNDPSINKLKSRIFEKSLDALMLERNLFTSNEDLHDQVTFKLKKQLIQCRLLYKKQTASKIRVVKYMLNKIISEAKANEIYSVLIEALIQQKYILGIRLGPEKFKEIEDETIFFEECFKAHQRATDCYFHLILNDVSVKSIKESDIENHIKHSIEQIEKDYTYTNSQSVNYYLHIMRFALLEKQKKYKEALVICNKLLLLMKTNKSIRRKDRMGFIYNHLGYFNIHLGHYELAASFNKKAVTYFIKNSVHMSMSYMQGFYSYFYSGNYSRASHYVSQLISQPKSNAGQFRSSIYIYFKACLLFAQGQYKEAQVLLREPLEIEKDKTRWNISLRILNIMIFVELNKKNEAIRANEALRKFLERTRKIDELKPRDLLISKLLKEMEKSNFVFDEENSLATQLLSQLSDKNSEVAWEHYTSELIPFHEWVEGKRVKTDILKQMEYA